MRLQIGISDEMASRLDRLSERMGVTRSALCAMLLGQGALSLEKSLSFVENMGFNDFKKIFDQMQAETKKDLPSAL